MSKPLSIDRAVDGNLKPVKDSDGTVTALEVSTDNVRVKNLDIAGNISSPLKVDGNLTVDAGGDITLDASGGDIHFAGQGTSYLTWASTGFLKMLAALDQDDYLGFEVYNSGISKIITIDDSGGNLGNLTLDIDGDIILDSATGVFIQKNNGTEFSVANSAYAGMILGYTAIGIDAAQDSVAPAATFAVTDADHKVTFIAPPSGKVEIFVSISAIATIQRWIQFVLSDNATYAAFSFPNATDVTNEHHIIDLQVDGYPRILTNNWVVEGLTAGTSYTWWLGAETEQAGRMTLWWGGNASGRYPPFIMKATALPATIYDGT